MRLGKDWVSSPVGLEMSHNFNMADGEDKTALPGKLYS